MIFIKKLKKILKLDFDTLNHKSDRLLRKGKKRNWINDRSIRWKIMTKFFGLRVKNYSYLIADSSEDKKAKSTKKIIIKSKLNFENY